MSTESPVQSKKYDHSHESSVLVGWSLPKVWRNNRPGPLVSAFYVFEPCMVAHHLRRTNVSPMTMEMPTFSHCQLCQSTSICLGKNEVGMHSHSILSATLLSPNLYNY